MNDCIFFEAFKEEEALLRQFLPDGVTAEFTSKTIQEYGADDLPADLISIRTQSEIPDAWAKSLKGVLSRSAGYDHILEYYARTGVQTPCGYLPEYCARAVAEQAVLMMLALFRKLKKQEDYLHSFYRDNLTGMEAKGRRALVVGVGRIGGEIVDIVKGLSMQVKGIDVEQKRGDIEFTTLIEGIPWADVIFCALPLTWLTRNMLGYKSLKKAKRGKSFVVNVARGEIMPLVDLKKLLDEEVLAGIALDTYDEESTIADYLRNQKGELTPAVKTMLELKERDNCIFTPHNAFNTLEAVERKARQSIEAVNHFLKNGTFPTLIPRETMSC